MTSYVQKVLQPGETVLHQAKLSWVMYLPGLLVLIGAALVFGIIRTIVGPVWWADIVSLIIAAIGFYLVAAEWFERWTTDTDRAAAIGDRVATGTVFMNRCDYVDPGLVWIGVKETGRGVTLSKLGYEHLTRPKSYHLRFKTG